MNIQEKNIYFRNIPKYAFLPTFVIIFILFILLSFFEYLFIEQKTILESIPISEIKPILFLFNSLFLILFLVTYYFNFKRFCTIENKTNIANQKYITNLKTIEEENNQIIANELSHFFHSIDDLILVIDEKSHKIIEINKKVTDKIGYRTEDLIDTTIFDLIEETSTLLLTNIISNKKENGYFKLKTIGDSKINCELTSFTGNWKHKNVFFLKFRELSNFIDEQKELIKFKAAVEQNPNLIVITDISGHIEYVNPTFTEVTGYQFSDVINLNPRFMKTEKQSESFYTQMWKTISEGNLWKGELLNRKANGQTFWEQLSISPIKNNAGEIINYIGIAQDISERKISDFKMKRMNDDLKLAESESRAAHEELKASSEALEFSYSELKIAKEKAEESDKLKSAFLANMSHEIRTPLNGIIGFSDLLTSENISKEKRLMYKSVITSSGNQLLKMVTDIIDISKLESGQVEIFKSPFNLNELLDELNEQFQTNESFQEKQELRIICKKELPDNYVNIVSDQNKIKQIYINLISNAIKFSYKGEINYGYTLNGDTIQCFVEDQGIGIAKENQEIIFKQFRQVEGSLNRQFGGAGIGLSISKGYIELLGGEIWLDSEEDKGSNFYFSIPYDIVF